MESARRTFLGWLVLLAKTYGFPLSDANGMLDMLRRYRGTPQNKTNDAWWTQDKERRFFLAQTVAEIAAGEFGNATILSVNSAGAISETSNTISVYNPYSSAVEADKKITAHETTNDGVFIIQSEDCT